MGRIRHKVIIDSKVIGRERHPTTLTMNERYGEAEVCNIYECPTLHSSVVYNIFEIFLNSLTGSYCYFIPTHSGILFVATDFGFRCVVFVLFVAGKNYHDLCTYHNRTLAMNMMQ